MASFNSAFAAARKAGKKTFTWNGKPYTTKLKSETKTSASAPSKSKKPKSRPTATTKPTSTRRRKSSGGTKSAPVKTTGTAASSKGRKRTRPSSKPMQGPSKSKLGLVNKIKNTPKKTSSGSRGRRKQTSGSDR